MMKRKFGDGLRSKTDTAMVNEALCKSFVITCPFSFMKFTNWELMCHCSNRSNDMDCNAPRIIGNCFSVWCGQSDASKDCADRGASRFVWTANFKADARINRHSACL